jgi:translation initiation factor 2 beta subunit (eIF-2beta)/eIF-5
MLLKDCLNTKENYNKLLDLLNKGAVIRLCNGELLIKKDNITNNIVISYKNNKIIENNYNHIKEFLLNENDFLVSFLNKMIENTSYYDLICRASNYLIYYDFNFEFIEEEDYLKYELYELFYEPFVKNKYNLLFTKYNKELYDYIDSLNNKDLKVNILLFQCESCGDIYDIHELIVGDDVNDYLELNKKINCNLENNININDLKICYNCYDAKIKKFKELNKNALQV